MLVRASQSTPGARALQSRNAAISACATCQRRSMRFGPWGSSEPNSELHREARRRHRSCRYRYMESLNRNLSWDNKMGSLESKEAMKQAMAHFMQTSSTPPDTSKYIHPENDIKSWSDDVSGLRPGRNIEDVEREAINHLLRPGHIGKIEFDMWKTPLRNIRKALQTHRAPKNVTPEEVLHATTSTQTENSVIDPITNRRVSKVSSSSSSPQSEDGSAALKISHSDATSFTPKFEDVDHHPNLKSNPSPTSATLSSAPKDGAEGHETAHIEEPPRFHKTTSKGASDKFNDLDKYRPLTWNEPNELQEPASEKSAEDYNDLPSYGAARWSKLDGVRELTPEERSKEYAELQKYSAVHWNEPDGLRKPTPEEQSKNYTDLDKYGPVYWNEPDGLRKPTPEELSKNYKDLDGYKPVMWNEPDGLPPLTPEEQSRKYDDLELYDGPRTAQQAAIDAFEASQMDPTPKGNPLPPKVEVEAENPGKDYKDLGKYGPVHWNEPDGLPPMTPEELSRQYDDLHLYRAGPRDGPEKTRSPAPAFLPTQEELSKYQFRGNSQSEKTERVHPEELTKRCKDLDKYRPREFDFPTSTNSLQSKEGLPNTGDVGFHTANSKSPANGQSGSNGAATNNSGNDEGDGDSFDTMTPQEIRANVLRRAKSSSLKQNPQGTNAGYQSHWEPIIEEIQHNPEKDHSKATHNLTGNYARDFPEEFTTSWSTTNSPSKSALYPKDLAEESASTGNMPRDDAEASSMDESFPAESSKLEPSLNRYARRRTSRTNGQEQLQATSDPYSKEPQGLETSYIEEIDGASTWPTLVKHYGSPAEHSSQDHATKSGPNTAGSVRYKILFHDSKTDSVRVAETSSAVADASNPLTPAEVILRLTNPSKFFPHFSSLEEEGFEIVSGSGDVLVFRDANSASSHADSNRNAAVNPIDLMGKPVTGNFASPTGFVNYDTLAEEHANKPAPPFRSNIDVRREEPVFSGGSYSYVPKRKKRSLGRKMVIGTAYIAGGTYAVGVIGEYFASARRQDRRRF